MKDLKKYLTYFGVLSLTTACVGLLLWQFYFKPELNSPSEGELNNAEAIKSWMEGMRADEAANEQSPDTTPAPVVEPVE